MLDGWVVMERFPRRLKPHPDKEFMARLKSGPFKTTTVEGEASLSAEFT
jgi:hypothetical protein